MSDPEKLVECDECGRSVAKIWRNYNGHKYCSTCYAREFKRLPCPRCGKFVRLPRHIPDAVCSKCELDKPCIRCGRSNYSIGRVTQYGPVCNACSVYFREKHPCDNCGTMSPCLARPTADNGQKRLCPKCVRSSHGRCGACGRHRRLQHTEDGRLLCRKCAEIGEVRCVQCGVSMSAGYGVRCEQCYWTDLLEKRIAINAAAFFSPAMAQHFDRFGKWLASRSGAHKAAITINRYLPFFVEMEAVWKETTSYEALLQHFGAKTLRRFCVPMLWLSEALGIELDARLREDSSERKRIEALSASIPVGTPAAEAIGIYRETLSAKMAAGKTSLQSIRLAMKPAVSLLLAADGAGRTLPNQSSVDLYLSQAPGQIAAITGFINFLNQRYGCWLSLQCISKKLGVMRRRRLEEQLVAMIRSAQSDEFQTNEWIAVALEYFHEVPRHVGCAVEVAAGAKCHEKGLEIRIGNQNYWIAIPESRRITSHQN